MELITQRQTILGVLDRWKRQYGSPSKYADKQAITDKLARLDLNTCAKEEVDNIIGNSSWTDLDCDECDKTVDMLVMVGQEPDYESSTAWLCKECLYKALDLVAKGECK